MTTKRTTHRSTAGTKLYAVRAKDGKFKDVQRYSRAHAADLRARSLDECGKKVGKLIDAARALRTNMVFIGGWGGNGREAIELVCKASAAADAAIAKAVKARAPEVKQRKRAK